MTKRLLRSDAPYPLYPPITDPKTVWNLWMHYGEPRCTEIVAGRDEPTAQDIARWRKLGLADD